MNFCLTCSRKTNSFICDSCKLNPYRVEEARQLLSKKKDFNRLRVTYDKSFAQLKNINTSLFWDKKIDKKTHYFPEDGMTSDRIKTAYEFMQIKKGKVLDIGAGFGYVENLVSKNKEIEIYGNDISANAIENLKKRYIGHFKKESALKMDYSNSYFDSVFMLEVLEHILPKNTFYVLGKIKKILKKGGHLIVSIPTNEGLEAMKDNPNGHVRLYTEDIIRAELEIANFKVIKVKTLFAFGRYYQFKKIIAKIIKRWKPNNIVVLAKSV